MDSFKRSAIGPAMLSVSSINIRGCTASGPHGSLTFKLVIWFNTISSVTYKSEMLESILLAIRGGEHAGELVLPNVGFLLVVELQGVFIVNV